MSAAGIGRVNRIWRPAAVLALAAPSARKARHALAFSPLRPPVPPGTTTAEATNLPPRTRREAVPRDGPSWAEGGRVSVNVVEELPPTDPPEAADAWVEHHWRRGGGLPVFVSVEDGSDDDPAAMGSRRTIYPVAMEETLAASGRVVPSTTLRYRVSNPGPFFSHLVDDSHVGTVTFSRDQGGNGAARMSWEVEFETTMFRDLYQGVTEFTVGVAANTVRESLLPSRILRVESTLSLPPDDDRDRDSSGDDDPIARVRREWLEFFWTRGGGLPLPPPIPYGEVLDEGGGGARRSILRVPPVLIDTVLSTSITEGEHAEVVYRIENPGWATFPFLIHTHLGRARFIKSRDSSGRAVDVIWEIEVRPFPSVAPLVERLLEMTASSIVRNLAVHLLEPNVQVMLRPPRGNANLLPEGIASMGSVPKATWLGGVLDEHLRDERSAWEQTLSLLRPWTWGRSGDGGGEDTVKFGWSEGEIRR